MILRLVVLLVALRSRGRTVVTALSSAGPSNLCGLAAVVLASATIAEAFGRLVAQAFVAGIFALAAYASYTHGRG